MEAPAAVYQKHIAHLYKIMLRGLYRKKILEKATSLNERYMIIGYQKSNIIESNFIAFSKP